MIYFLQDSLTCDIKIGFALNDAEARRAVLQTGNPRQLVMLLVTDGDRAEESRLHSLFAASRGLGEWFRPTPDILLFIIGVTQRSHWEGGLRHGTEIEAKAANERIELAVIEATNEQCEQCNFPRAVQWLQSEINNRDYEEFLMHEAHCGPNN